MAQRVLPPRLQRSASGVSAAARGRRRCPLCRCAAATPSAAAALNDRDGQTIVALATAVVPQAGGVAIVRMSGPEAQQVARAVFSPGRPRPRRPARDADTWTMTSHLASYGGVYDSNERLVDEARRIAHPAAATLSRR